MLIEGQQLLTEAVRFLPLIAPLGPPIIAMARKKQAKLPKLPNLKPPKPELTKKDLAVDQAFGLVYFPDGKTERVGAVRSLLEKLGIIIFSNNPN